MRSACVLKRGSSSRPAMSERRADVLHGIGLEGADHHQRAVGRLEHAGERHRAPVQLIAAHHLRGGFLGLRRDHGVEQRHVELLAPARLLPLQQREQHALHQMHAGRIIREGRRVDRERIALARAARHHAGHRLRQHVLPALVRVGAGEAEAGADRVDQARVRSSSVPRSRAPCAPSRRRGNCSPPRRRRGSGPSARRAPRACSGRARPSACCG